MHDEILKLQIFTNSQVAL